MTHKIAVLMGSNSDRETMQHCVDLLQEFGIETNWKVLSAHRTPRETVAFVEQAESDGYSAFICGAGLAAHLAGVVAAHTSLPVLGCPMKGGVMDGLDALLSTVQMPGGIPVATFGLGSHGAKNAALFCVAMLALQDESLKTRLQNFRRQQAEKILNDNR